MSMALAFISTLYLALAAAPVGEDAGCVLRSTYGSPVLLGDATKQLVHLAPSSCEKLKEGNALLVNSEDSKLRVSVLLSNEQSIWKLDVSSEVPAPTDQTAPVSSVWNLFSSAADMSSGRPPLGQVILTPIVVTIRSKTVVSYGREQGLTEALAQASKAPGIAYYVDPVAGGTSRLMNTTHLDIPALGPVARWNVRSNVILLNAEGTPCTPSTCSNAQRTMDVIHFAAPTVSSAPLWAEIEAERPLSKGTTTGRSPDAFTLKAKLADASEFSAVPLDISDVLYVRCQKDVRLRRHDIIRNNDLAAITNGAAYNNRCTLVISETDITFAVALKHGIEHFRHICRTSYRKSVAEVDEPRNREVRGIVAADESTTQFERTERMRKELGEKECARLQASSGEVVTVITAPEAKSQKKAEEFRKTRQFLERSLQARIMAVLEAKIAVNAKMSRAEADAEAVAEVADEQARIDEVLRVDALKRLYGQQRLAYFVFTDREKREASRRNILFSAQMTGRMEIPLKLDGEAPSQDRPYHFEAYVQPATAAEDLSPSLDNLPRQRYSCTLRPKGPFGVTHTRYTLGSQGIRVFATIPLGLATVRFPAAGLDIKSTRDSTIAQLATLTTGLLLTFEPWDYTRGTNMFALPFRAQVGLLLSNWAKGVFHPSTYAGLAFTLPVVKGANQLDIDLALGLGWEVDLRSGYEKFEQRNHLLITFGMNFLSLFGPQSAPRGK